MTEHVVTSLHHC